MKFTLSWLKEHLATDASIDAIVETMTMTGLEVESVENAGEKLKRLHGRARDQRSETPERRQAASLPSRNRARKSRDRLRRTERARGPRHRVRADRHVHSGVSGITLEPKPVRGVVSNGMLCSGAELELDTDADGILELDADLKVGTPLAEALGLNDPVVDIEVTPNRPDWLGVAGIARDLAAAGVGKQTTKPIHTESPDVTSRPQKVEIDDTHCVPDVRQPLHSRRQERPVAGVAAATPARHWSKADQRAWSTSPI